MRMTVVVPTYNERDTVPLLLRRLAAVVERSGLDGEAVVVDDASPDGTGDVAARVALELRDIMPIVVAGRPGKAGLTSAVLEGVRRGRGDVVVVMDGDLSHPPEVVPDLLGAVAAGADVAVGSRYVAGGGVAGWPVHRRVLSWGAAHLARLLLGLRVRDPVSGFFAARRRIFEAVRFEGRGYKLLVEILASGRAGRIAEVPYRFTERAHGRSKLGAGEIAEYVRLLRRLRRSQITRHRRDADR